MSETVFLPHRQGIIHAAKIHDNGRSMQDTRDLKRDTGLPNNDDFETFLFDFTLPMGNAVADSPHFTLRSGNAIAVYLSADGASRGPLYRTNPADFRVM